MRMAAYVTAAIVASVGPAMALPVSGTALGSFGGYNGNGSGAVTTISNNDANGVAQFTFGDRQTSGITFDGYGTNGGVPFLGDLDTPFAIGDVAAFKGPTSSYPSVGTSITLTTTLSFTAPYAFTRTLTYTFNIGLFPGLEAGTQDANLFGVPDVHPATFGYNGTLYDVSLVGFDPDGETFDISLPQGEPYTGSLYAQVSADPTPVPEPATLGLLAAGVLAAAIRRRRT